MVLLASKGQVLIVQQDNHNRANDEASLIPRAAPANHLASPWGLVLSLFRRLRPTRWRVTARLSQTCPSLSGSFLRTWPTWRSPRAGIAFRTEGSTSRKASNLCVVQLVYLIFSLQALSLWLCMCSSRSRCASAGGARGPGSADERALVDDEPGQEVEVDRPSVLRCLWATTLDWGLST